MNLNLLRFKIVRLLKMQDPKAAFLRQNADCEMSPTHTACSIPL